MSDIKEGKFRKGGIIPNDGSPRPAQPPAAMAPIEPNDKPKVNFGKPKSFEKMLLQTIKIKENDLSQAEKEVAAGLEVRQAVVRVLKVTETERDRYKEALRQIVKDYNAAENMRDVARKALQEPK